MSLPYETPETNALEHRLPRPHEEWILALRRLERQRNVLRDRIVKALACIAANETDAAALRDELEEILAP